VKSSDPTVEGVRIFAIMILIAQLSIWDQARSESILKIKPEYTLRIIIFKNLEGEQLSVRGGGFLLSRLLFLGLFFVVHVIVVYISLRDDGR
jgi:hypothetical protein